MTESKYFYFRDSKLHCVTKIMKDEFIECSQEFADYIKDKLTNAYQNKQTILKILYQDLINNSAKIKEY